MMLNRKKSILAFLLTLLLLLGMSIVLVDRPAEAVSKTELNALKKQQSQLADKKADLQKQAAAISAQVNSQTEKLRLLNAQLDVTVSELLNLSDQIGFYTSSIAEMENTLNAEEQKEQALLTQYGVRIRAMEEAGPIPYITILFEANSFADLLSRIDTIREIMSYDNGLIVDVQAAQVMVAQSKEDMEAEMAEQQTIFDSYQEKADDLAAQQNEVNAVLESLSADSAEYNKQIETVAALQSSIGAQISDMQYKLAEQERIKAEQAAALKAAQEKNKKWYNDAAGSGTGTGQDIVDYAKTFLGVPYVYGGTSPKGFDCSGLVYYCYKNFGYSVNRTASGQALNGKSVSSSELKAGDVIIFSDRGGRNIGHCGIYIGDGQFIHAPHTGDVVKISSLSDTYYKNHYMYARRIIND